ncbi:MAG: hypothetical protein IBJ00_03140, partial [Alphaproteobacteria bacterium]|nr:hypothetical protein [Alphaproteobacteria bacterium]
RYNAVFNTLPLKSAQVYPFYDVGKVWQRKHGENNRDASAASAGFGTRLTTLKFLGIDLELAKPLTRGVEERILKGKHKKPWRFYFKVATQF